MKSKLLTSLAMALALAVGTSALTPRNANAYIAVSSALNDYNWMWLWVGGDDSDAAIATVGCLLLLPLCVLDQKTNSNSVAVSTSDLLANGYTMDQVKQIQKDQATLIKNLKAAHARLEVRDTDTKASFETDIRTMVPNVSQTYLDFATSSVNLK